MKSALVDTSFLVSLVSSRERQHKACVQVAQTIQTQLVIPITVLPETTHLIATRISHRAMRAFIRQLQSPHWYIENLGMNDFERAAEILELYHDTELDFADSTLVAIAERMNIETILTLDQRDFRMIRPSHVDYFTILP